jgi:hypothetical protein
MARLVVGCDMTLRHLELGLPLHTIAGYFARRDVCVNSGLYLS